MQESKLLGTLLPSHPDLIPIIQSIREKYDLPELSPDDEPITELHLGDEIVPLEGFRRDIGEILRENLDFLTPSVLKKYEAGRALNKLEEVRGLEGVPDNIKADINKLLILIKGMASPIFQGIEDFIDGIADMLYTFLLTGESGEVPTEWMSKVMTIKDDDETSILVSANQLANPEEVIRQFRHAYQETFGAYRPKMTKTIVSTAHYMQLKRRKKPWNFIVEEFIRLEDIYMPKNKSSKQYLDHKRKCEQVLKKRIQRSEKILEIILKDN